MKNKIILALLIAAMGVLFTACTSDDDTPDPVEAPADVREQALGSYSGVFEFGTQENPGQNVQVTKGSSTDALAISWNGVIVKGTKVQEASGGITFDIEDFQTSTTQYKGYDGITLGSTKYNAAYFQEGKRLVLYVEIYQNNTYQGIGVLTVNKI